MRVLVVEDDELQRRVLVRRLAALGVEYIDEANDGAAALRLLHQTHDISLIISDLAMPHMDGLELLCEVREFDRSLAFAIHSALDRELLTCMELMARERRMRFLGALSKPATNAELTTLLSRARQNHTTMRPPISAVSPEEIHAGFANKRFIPHYQPKVAFSDRSLIGVEALARLAHPTRGIVPPGAFLDEIDRLNLQHQLTFAIIDGVITTLQHWMQIGIAVPVAVNLSLGFLSQPGSADQIHKVVADSKVPTDLINFEITEQVAMSDVGTCLENIARLRMKGYQFAIDDFGVGYSSVQQLMRIPASTMKLDRSFVSGVIPGSRAALMMGALIGMAHELDMKVVAEGIETRAEWDFLAHLGCDVAQGYFIARPMPAEALHQWSVGDLL